MKSRILIGFVGLLVVSLVVGDALARGRGGGGGGSRGGGGASRGGGGRSSPSMSRSSSPSRGSSQASRSQPSRSQPSRSQPSRSQAGSRAGQNPFGQGQAGNRAGSAPGGRDSAGDINSFLNISPGGGAAAGAAAGNRAANRPNAGERGPNSERGTQRTDNRQDRSGNRQDRQAARPNSPQERADHRQDRGENVRNEFKDNHPRADFWSDHPNAAIRRMNRPYRWATWAVMGGWYGGSSGSGQYYDYGEGGNCYYEDDQVYYDGEPVATADEYAEQAMGYAEAGANTIDESVASNTDIEWMPLGVFAMVNEDAGEPTLYMQLQIAKDGTIGGTYANTANDTSATIQGSVDTESQRAAWTIGDNYNTVIETGLYNLTKDEAPALIHFGTEKTQQWLLVRMDDPEVEGGGQ